AEPVLGAVVPLREHGALVRLAGPSAVPDQPDLIVVVLEAEVRLLTGVLSAVHGDAVGDTAAGEVVVEPVHVPAGVRHALFEAGRFGDVDAALLVEAERDRVGHQRLGSPRLHLPPPLHPPPPEGFPRPTPA